MADSFSIPFFTAALLGLLTWFLALSWLKESLREGCLQTEKPNTNLRTLVFTLRPLLSLTLVAQFALATFEGTFALYAQAMFGYGPVQVGTAFVVCGLVMTLFQAGAVSFLTQRVREIHQLAAGFGLMAASILMFTGAHSTPLVFLLIAAFALGMALISPNLATLISKRGGPQAGAALGMQNAANSLGQAAGPLLGEPPGTCERLYRRPIMRSCERTRLTSAS